MSEYNTFSERDDTTRRQMFLGGLVIVSAIALGACGAESAAPDSGLRHSTSAALPSPEIPGAEGLADPVRRKTADKIVSTFENSTTEIQYDYVEVHPDDRGIHVGREGFTTRDGDALLAITGYVKQHPDSPLKDFIPRLQEVVGSDEISGLEDFGAAWVAACKDPAFRRAQDKVVNELYFDPAMRWSEKLNIQTAVGQLILYDTMIMHGEGNDQDGFAAIARRTMNDFPRDSMSEQRWLNHFLTVRGKDIAHAYDPGTRELWAQATDRPENLRDLLNSGNPELKLPVTWVAYGDHFQDRG